MSDQGHKAEGAKTASTTGHGVELDIIEAGYRCVSDSDAFDDLVSAWGARLDLVENGLADELDSPMLRSHLDKVRGLFAKLPEPDTADIAEQTVREVSSPAMVLSPSGHVRALNEKAGHAFGIRQGAPTDFRWLDAASRAEFEQVRNSARKSGNRRHAIVRILADQENIDHRSQMLAEVFLLPVMGDDLTLIAVRALDLVWNEQVSALLSEAFGLTSAETEVSRTLLEEGDTALVAERRGVSVLTVRTQLRTIFSKTETGNQVDLIRLLSMVCARAGQAEAGEEVGWQDPLFHEDTFVDEHGKVIAYSWMGAENGTPMILVHGPMTGYVLGADVQDALAASGIKLWTICRPGFGHSEPDDSLSALDAGAASIAGLMDHLDIDRCPLVTLASGMIPAVKVMAAQPDRVSSILALGGCHPLDNRASRRFLPPNHRVFLSLVRFSNAAAEFAALAGYRIVRQKGFAFALQRMFSNCPEDAATMRDPNMVAMLSASMGMAIVDGHKGWLRDMQMMIDNTWRDDLTRIQNPIHVLHGVQDPIYRIEILRSLSEKHSNITLETVDNAGQLLAHQHPDAVIRSLLALKDRGAK